MSGGLIMMGVSRFWQTVIKGVVIVVAVVIDQAQSRLQARLALAQEAATIRQCGSWIFGFIRLR
jgi:erythritol transport system permease protein